MTKTTERAQPKVAPPRETVLGITLYERVTSLLLALLLTLGGVAAGLGALWASNHLARPTPLVTGVELVDAVFTDDLGGGDLYGVIEGDREIPGPESDKAATSDESDGPSVEKIALEATISDVADRASEATEFADKLFVSAPPGLAIGSRGTNNLARVGLGKGKKGGAAAADRWEIVFEKGVSEAEYARQLDFLQIELGVVVDGKLYRVSQFSSARPVVRVTEPRASEHEVVFVWRDERRRQTDIGLMRKAHEVSVAENAVVLHLCPSATALKLERLERDYATAHGRPDMRVVAKTRFVLRKADIGYDIEIFNQRYFVKYEGEARP